MYCHHLFHHLKIYIVVKIIKARMFRIIVIVAIFAAVPWAMHYNLNYDLYGTIDRPAPPIFIQIVTVDVGVFNNTLKANAAKYSVQFSGVKIFVLPLIAEQITMQEFDIRIIKNDGTLHAFVSSTQTREAIKHCKDFLDEIAQENENLKIH